MKAVLVADANHRNYHAKDFFRVYSDNVLEKLSDLVELAGEPVFLSEFDRKADILRETELIFSNWGMPELTSDQIRRYLPKIRAVFYAGGDTSPFAAPFFQAGAKVYATGHANAVPASEYALAHIILANKSVLRGIRNYRSEATYKMSRSTVSDRSGNYQSVVGILGVGRVGSRVAEKLRSFDVTVCGCDPFLPPYKAQALGIEIVDLEELFARCDTVTCHIPEWSTNRGLITGELLLSMPRFGTFINAAQASVVDQEGLIRALEKRKDLTAILDSTDPMPLSADHPLLNMENVFVTPHIAGSFGGEMERMGEMVVDALKDYLNHKESIHEVNREQLPD